jgi:Recombinase zinc beta ribbon domain
LRKLLYCERCGSRMHGTRGSKTAVRRYMCSTRRYGNPCGERIVKAEQLEGQLVDWIRDFQPDGELLDVLLQTLQADNATTVGQPAERRGELLDQLKRLQDLYVLGDLTKAQYVMRRQALEEEVQRLAPPTEPAIDQARALLDDFPRFWDLETDPAERRNSSSPCSSRYGHKTGRSSPYSPTTPSCPTSKQPSRITNTTPERGGAESGNDGTRTRDLRRDRPAL